MYGEPIKIQIGKIFMNRTRKYMFPVIKEYGIDFTFKLNTLFKVAIGIGDIIINKCGLHHENHFFILIDTLVNTSQFISIMDDIRRHPSYEDDYVYGNIQNTRFHMLVIKIPNEYIGTFEKFKKSKYSEMYTAQDLKKFFYFDSEKATDEYKNIQKVLIKDHNYKFEFVKIIQKEFDIPFGIDELSETTELDLQILEKEEIFNAYLNHDKDRSD